MSLKFGIYLVEQRIISSEQFCGLIKIQQESTSALSTIALRKNLMTIRQVANVLERTEASPGRDFQSVATEMGYLHTKEVDYLVQVQQTTSESIRSLTVECGLLTERQASVLFIHFQKMSAKKRTAQSSKPQAQPAAPVQPQANPASAKSSAPASRPKQPNFRRRPMIIERQSTNV